MQSSRRTISHLVPSLGLVLSVLGCPAEDGSATPDGGSSDTGPTADSSATGTGHDIESCSDMASLFVNAPTTTATNECALTNGSTTTCCTFTFSSDLVEDGPYCPASRTSPPPYGLSVYDGATNPGLRPFNGAYLDDIEADGYAPMVDAQGNTNIVTGLDAGPGGSGSNCLAMDQDPELTIEVSVPLSPTMADSPTQLREVENLGVSLMGVPGTGHPPSATLGPQMGGPGGGTTDAINVPSIGSCGAHPDPGGYLHDHFVPQVMNAVLLANGIDANDVECTTYPQEATALYGFAKDGFPIYASRDEDGIPDDLDACLGHAHATAQYPSGTYHYHASETAAPNFMSCLSGVPVTQSFRYY